MISPAKLASLFDQPTVWTFAANCPICNLHGLRIHHGNGETKIRCINQCRGVDILAQVGLTPSDLRQNLSGLLTGLVPSESVQTASTEPPTTAQGSTDVKGGE